ncbi:hypothetical protein LBMAG52_03720 [Planctomycetia bacterium]|nr:hypothetical protein LBMAG52_03720 [Planctomycetia bacterium]
MDSARELAVVREGFTGTGSLFSVALESDELVVRDSATGSITSELTGSADCVSFGSVVVEIEDNTAAEHHSGSISNFGSDSDTASSGTTSMSLREIGVGLVKL